MVEEVVGRVMMEVVIKVRVIMVGSVIVVKLVLIEAVVLGWSVMKTLITDL